MLQISANFSVSPYRTNPVPAGKVILTNDSTQVEELFLCYSFNAQHSDQRSNFVSSVRPRQHKKLPDNQILMQLSNGQPLICSQNSPLYVYQLYFNPRYLNVKLM